jgi:CO/xanthine dehydrogenase FAD-binding subunit
VQDSTAVTSASPATASTASTRSSPTTSCASAHPSDVAAALLALDATAHVGARTLPSPTSYRLPSDDDAETTTLEPGEVILEVTFDECEQSVYLKAMERKRWAFPLVGVAAVRRSDARRARRRRTDSVAPRRRRAGRCNLRSAERLQGRHRPRAS